MFTGHGRPKPASTLQTAGSVGGPLDVTVANAWPGATTILVIGGAQTSIPLGGATLLVLPAAQASVVISGSGDATLNLTIPQEVAYAGGSLFWQGWVFGDPGGIATTAGLETRLGF